MQYQHLNLSYLKYFCDAVRLKGVSAAAKVNFVTQSAISQGISKLEKSLDVQLVAHHPNHFRLTPEGQTVFNQSLDILKRVAEFRDNLMKEDNLGDLEFVCTYSFALAVIPQYLKKFQQAYPSVKINFLLGNNAEIKSMVKLGVVDFGILPNEDDLEEFHSRDIYFGNLGLYTAKSIKKADLKKLGFILAKPNNKERLFLEAAYHKKFGKLPKGILDVGSWEVMATLAASGMGISYFPDYVYRKKEYHLQPVDLGLDLEKYTISAIFPRGMKWRKSSDIFLSLFNH